VPLNDEIDVRDLLRIRWYDSFFLLFKKLSYGKEVVVFIFELGELWT